MTDIIIGPTVVERFTDFVTDAPLADDPTNSDYIPLIQDGITKKLPAGSTTRDNLETVVVTSGSSYTAGATDQYVVVKKTIPSVTTILLPPAPAQGHQLRVKDGAGNAGTYPITVDGNGKNIDGGTIASIPFDYGALYVIYDGTKWGIN